MIWNITVVYTCQGVLNILIPIGLELARLADLPEDVLTEGRKMAEKLTALHAKRQGESESGKISARRKALLRVKNSSSFLSVSPDLMDATAPNAARSGTGSLSVTRRGFVGLHRTIPKGHCPCTSSEYVMITKIYML
jgi:hypothetical protein